MIQNEEIKKYFSQNSDVPTKCEVVKRFIFDKTNQEVQFNEPYGKISPGLTFMFLEPIFDYDILEYMYFCSMKYFKRVIKI